MTLNESLKLTVVLCLHKAPHPQLQISKYQIFSMPPSKSLKNKVSYALSLVIIQTNDV